MPRPLRFMPEPGTLFEITNRTVMGRLLLRPSEELNAILLGCLGRALDQFPEIGIFAFFWASNHFHLLLRGLSSQAISAFMGYLESNIARQVNKLHGWHGPFWERRYRAIPIRDDEALVARLRYILSHGCKEGLVMMPGDWPGVSCLPALLEGKQLEGVWVDHTALHRKPRSSSDPSQDPMGCEDGLKPEEAFIRYPIPMAPLPCWADLSEEARQAKVRAMVADIEAETKERHEKEGTRPMGVHRILAQHPHGIPKEVKRSRAPSCHTASAVLWKAYRAAYRTFASVFREASARLRAGDLTAIFPEHCFPPALAYQGAGPP
ncbi:MAG TPA: transposase [Myxococcota bacterium]|nr:transposase [Myxococcota bacterium]